MFSFGWSEIALTAIIVIIVVGPKEIPNLLRQLGSFSRSIKKITREFKSSLNEITNDSELKKVKDSLNDINSLKDEINPINDIKGKKDSNKKSSNVFEKEIIDLKNLDNKLK